MTKWLLVVIFLLLNISSYEKKNSTELNIATYKQILCGGSVKTWTLNKLFINGTESTLTPGQSYQIIIEAGGIGNKNSAFITYGGNTSFGWFFASGGNAGRVGGNIIWITGSNLPLKCNDWAMPPGSVSGYGAGGPQASNGAQGLAIIYY